MKLANRANIFLAAIAVLILALGFFGYRFSHYGQVGTPGPDGAAKSDQKPPDAYKPRP